MQNQKNAVELKEIFRNINELMNTSEKMLQKGAHNLQNNANEKENKTKNETNVRIEDVLPVSSYDPPQMDFATEQFIGVNDNFKNVDIETYANARIRTYETTGKLINFLINELPFISDTVMRNPLCQEISCDIEFLRADLDTRYQYSSFLDSTLSDQISKISENNE